MRASVHIHVWVSGCCGPGLGGPAGAAVVRLLALSRRGRCPLPSSPSPGPPQPGPRLPASSASASGRAGLKPYQVRSRLPSQKHEPRRRRPQLPLLGGFRAGGLLLPASVSGNGRGRKLPAEAKALDSLPLHVQFPGAHPAPHRVPCRPRGPPPLTTHCCSGGGCLVGARPIPPVPRICAMTLGKSFQELPASVTSVETGTRGRA